MPDRMHGYVPVLAICVVGIGFLSIGSFRPPTQALARAQAVSGGDRLQWLTLTVNDKGPVNCAVAVELIGDESSIWALEASVVSTSGSTPPTSSHPQRLRGRELSRFLVSAQCGPNELKLVLKRDAHPERVVGIDIPFEVGTNRGTARRHYLVPEIRFDESAKRSTWVKWDVESTRLPIVRLTVVDETGTVVRSWPPNMLQAGLTTILWDGRDNANNLVADGRYLLCVEEDGDREGVFDPMRLTVNPSG